LLLYVLKLIYLIFTTDLYSLLILFLRTYKPTVSYRDHWRNSVFVQHYLVSNYSSPNKNWQLRII